MSGIQLPGFDLIEEIGRGGMATVWKARQISLNRVVAIKFLQAKLARDPADVQRFQTEAQSAARLKHPSIVQVYDARMEQGLYYLVMEHIEGYTVGQWLRRRGVLGERDALLLADCVADALQYAWNRERIIHCDIKPENIMVDADGTVKVADLGLARSIRAMTAESPSDEVLGTPGYMSPEQVTGAADLDFRTDVYSLGAMIYQMVTGRMLFEGHDDAEVMRMQVKECVPDPQDVNPKLSLGLAWLLEKMLAKDQRDRHEAWEAVRTDIDRVRRRLVPLAKGLPDGRSTIRRGLRRSKADYASYRRRGEQTSTVRVWVGLAIVAVLAWVYFLTRQGVTIGTTTSAGGARVTPTDAGPRPAGRAARAKELYDAALRWSDQHPEQYDQSIAHFRRVTDEAPDTEYATRAGQELARLSAAKQASVNIVLNDLKRKADALAGQHKFDEAIALYEKYTGRWAAETVQWRGSGVGDIRAKRKLLDDTRRADQERLDQGLQETLDRAVSDLVAGRLQAAADTIRNAAGNPVLSARQSDLQRLLKILDEAARVDDRVLESFRRQVGTEIGIQLASGKTKIVIVSVKDNGEIEAMEHRAVGPAVASRRITIKLDDLPARERLDRMGADNDPAVALAKGVMIMAARSFDSAKRHFWLVDPLISERLVGRVENMERATASPPAMPREGPGF